MEPLYYVMAIMGCGDAGAQCQQTRIEPVRYESAAQCQAAMIGVLQRSAEMEYPVVQATCQKRGMSVAEAKDVRRG